MNKGEYNPRRYAAITRAVFRSMPMMRSAAIYIARYADAAPHYARQRGIAALRMQQRLMPPIYCVAGSMLDDAAVAILMITITIRRRYYDFSCCRY